MTDLSEHSSKNRVGFTTWIVIGLLAGLAWGIFLGETGSWVKWIGDAFVGLLQMAVLPFVAISLIANVGRLSPSEGLRLLGVTCQVLVVLLVIGLVVLVAMSQSFPNWDSGSFFGSRFTEEPDPPDWLDLFIPSNPFRSLSESAIPAVVVFSLSIGVALMTVRNKEALLAPMDVVVAALARLNSLVVKLTPVGMFGLVGYAAGTVDLAEFTLIQGYLLSFGAAALLVSSFVLPMFIAAVTPLNYGEVMRASRAPLIAAFVIGNSFVVLPLIIEATRQLLADHKMLNSDSLEDPEYLVPLAYPFPDIGRVVGIIFIPFAAWFYGTQLELPRTMVVTGIGVVGSFAKPVITMPLMLETAELPSDIFNLYLASGVIAARFGDLMKTMHMVAFAVLTICMLNRLVRIKWPALFAWAGVSLALLTLTVVGLRSYLEFNFKETYSREKLVTEREMTFPRFRTHSRIQASELQSSSPNPEAIQAGESRVDRITRRGRIRVGIDADRLPFCYRNRSGQLIGFDVELAYYLADDLQVDLEFVPIRQGRLQEDLADDHFDVAMSAIEGTVLQASRLPAIDPYMNVTLAVVVPDHDRSDFATVDRIKQIESLRLAVIRNSFFSERASKVLPQNTQLVTLESAKEYFEGAHRDVDGLVINAESGSAWTLRYPRFTVANPLKGRVQIPLYYLTDRDFAFETFLQNWLSLKRADGTYQQLYDYWILGMDEQIREPRWSVIRNVLGWVD